MNCPFCLSEPLPVSGYECGSGPNRSQRTDDCYEREVRRFCIRVADLDGELVAANERIKSLEEAGDVLRERIDDLDGSLAEWRDYAEGLEDVGNEMKDGATTPDQVAWDRQIKRRPSQ